MSGAAAGAGPDAGPFVAEAAIPDLVAMLRALGHAALADRVLAKVEECRREGRPPRIGLPRISGACEKFVGDRQPGDEPFEILRWDDTGPDPVIPWLVHRRRANVEACNYAPRARLADGRIVGPDWFPEDHLPSSSEAVGQDSLPSSSEAVGQTKTEQLP